MARTVVGLTRDVLTRLPEQARSCAFWELDPVTRMQRPEAGERIRAKECWVSETLLSWGCCGQVVLLDGEPAGYLLYAPPAFVPSAESFPTAPVSEDAVLLTTGQVLEPFRGTGLGRILVQAVVKDLARRRIRAVEAFAAPAPSACTGDPRTPCLLPAEFLCRVGFRTVRPHAQTPRLRLDVRSLATWRSDVEQAVDRLLGSLRPAAPVA